MTKEDYSEWKEFKRDIKDSFKGVSRTTDKIFDKVDEVNVNVATLTNEVSHKVGEAELSEFVDKKIAVCRKDFGEKKKKESKKGHPDWVIFLRRMSYVAVPLGTLIAGYLTGR